MLVAQLGPDEATRVLGPDAKAAAEAAAKAKDASKGGKKK
jgi:hypothetical protein